MRWSRPFFAVFPITFALAGIAILLGSLLLLQFRTPFSGPIGYQPHAARQIHTASESFSTHETTVPEPVLNHSEPDWRSKLVEIDRIQGVPVFAQTEYILLSDASPKPADSQYSNCYVKNIKAEFDIYSRELLNKIGLRGIVLCDDLTVGVRKVSGLALTHEGIVFLYVPKQSELMVPTSRGFHHEIFHLIETRDDVARVWLDPDWESLNGETFRYGRGEIDQRAPGFLGKYSRSAVQEDKAVFILT